MWDAGEQYWYHLKNLLNMPKRCKPCREKKKDEKRNLPRQYSQMTCDRCGAPTVVPFIPTGIKPVYCRKCMTAAQA